MLSHIPFNFDKMKKEDIDKEILRVGISAELDAVNLYEEMAAITDDEAVKKVLLDVAGEEKTHIGEFQALLLERDEEQARELEKGKEEIRELKEE